MQKDDTIMKTQKNKYLELIKYLDENKIEWKEIQEEFESDCIDCNVNIFNKTVFYLKNNKENYKKFYYEQHEKNCNMIKDLDDMFDSEY